MTTNPSTLVLSREDAVLWIRLNRPEARNGIDPVMCSELRTVLEEADVDTSVRALVVTGTGPDFCVGADIPASAGAAAGGTVGLLDYRRSLAPYQELFRTYWELETPAVSAVNGTIAGAGWMLGLLADLVVGAEGARWIHVFARRGMVPHAGDPFFLPRILPFHKLNEAALTGDRFTSETLNEWGAVNRLVPADRVEPVARELAQKLAAGPTRSLGKTKRLYRRSLVSDMVTSFDEEAATAALLSQTRDRIEGVKSLLEGRPAVFTGE
jgi:2-(1,2-epoxy-1,2-dihydrophenyl)acetyl-CoA isomerase